MEENMEKDGECRGLLGVTKEAVRVHWIGAWTTPNISPGLLSPS